MSIPGAGAPPPGWYADGTGGTRWWDGQGWTQHVAPTAPVVPQAPAPPAPAASLASSYSLPPADVSWSTPPPAGSNVWAPTSSPAAASPARRTGLVLALVGAAAGVLVVGGVAAVVATRSSSTPTATASTSAPPTSGSSPSSPAPSSSSSSPATTGVKPVASARQGSVVYSDTFDNPASGWGKLALPSGTKFGYVDGQYVVVAKGNLHHYSYAPYSDPVPQISVTADYVTVAARAGGSGVGVSCDQGEGKATVLYEFMVYPGKQWFIEEVRGAISADPPTSVLAHGPAAVKPGKISVTGVCTTSADGRTTVATLFVNGRKLGQGRSTVKPPADGWFAGIDVASVGGKAQTVAVETLTVRDTNS